MILGLVDEAVAAGARQHKVCELLGLDARTLQRWRTQDIGEDGRAGFKELFEGGPEQARAVVAKLDEIAQSVPAS